MDKDMDQSSFASILAGVKKMRQDYEVTQPSRERAEAVEKEKTDDNGKGSENVEKGSENGTNGATNETSYQRHTLATPNAAIVPPKQTQNQSQNQNQNQNQKNQSSGPASRQSPIPVPVGQRRDASAVHSYTSIQVAPSQKGNPLLESPQMKAIPWTYNGQILSDYYINATVQVLFLSLKYHKLRPEYVWRRLEKLRGGLNSVTADDVLRVLLVVVDIDSPQEVIRKLSVMCIKNDLTMVVAWSFEEAGTYVSALKANEMARTKVDSSIQGVKKGDYNTTVLNSLTTVRAVNKTDVANLLANCRSFKNVVLQATQGDGLEGIPGLGGKKVDFLAQAFGEPFIFNKEG